MQIPEHSRWIGQDGPERDVVVSCRVRLARNVAGFPFVAKANDSQRRELTNLARQVLSGLGQPGGLLWVDLLQSTAQDRRLLVERHLISKHHAEAEHPRGVAISHDETLSIMVNEEDHLRMQLLAPGLSFQQIYSTINDLDDRVEAQVDYAFSKRWGYLTACPTNVGTGIRFSVMMHLPGLRLTNELERVRRAAKELNLAVRGYYGEGSESAGDFYQVSNQVTLGLSEEELLEHFEVMVVPRILEYERRAREMLAESKPTLLDDRIHRALGILRGARLLGAEEAMKLLSRIRLGIHMGRLTDLDLGAVNMLFLQIQPGHLRMRFQEPLHADQIREARASLVRTTLAEKRPPATGR